MYVCVHNGEKKTNKEENIIILEGRFGFKSADRAETLVV